VSQPATVPTVIDRTQPWLGLTSYRETDTELFFGREKEGEELLRLVRREALTVVFGPSGTGKTSLLNAGLFPRLRESALLPIYIRLDHSADSPDYVEQVRKLITKALHGDAAHPIEEEALAPPQAPTNQETLWEYLHRVVFWDWRNNPVTPVLVFDQFEEIFTLARDREATEEFLAALADLVENYIPASVRSRMETHGENIPFSHEEPKVKTIPFPHDEPKSKVILSLREDFVWRLDGLRKSMPSVMHNRFTVAKMHGGQALDAVIKPGQGIVDRPVALQIVSYVAGRDKSLPTADSEDLDLDELQVDPALLSVVCRELNARRIEQERNQITGDLVEQAATNILDDFYERSFEGLNPRLRVFVEERLLTTTGFRSTVPLEEATRGGITAGDIGTLEDRRLVRTEKRLGIPHVELTHDLLTKVVQKSRDVRWAQEAREHEWQAREARERERAEQTQREQESRAKQQKTRRLVILATLALLGLAVTSVIAVYAWQQRQLAVQKNQDLTNLYEQLGQKDTTLEEQKDDLTQYTHKLKQQTTELNNQKKALQEQTRIAKDLKAKAENESAKDKVSRNEADSIRLASYALDLIDSEDPKQGPERGAVLALEASDRMFTPEAEDALHKSIKAERLLNALPTLRGSLGAFSPDRRYYAAGNQNGYVYIYDLWSETPDKTVVKIKHPGQLYALGFSPPDSKYLATAGADKSVHLWSVADGKAVTSDRMVHQGGIRAIAFSPDGKLLASASDDKTAQIWSVPDGSQFGDPLTLDKPVGFVAFSSTGKYVATGSDEAVRVWEVLDLRRGALPLPLNRGSKVHAIAFNPKIEEQLVIISGGGSNEAGIVETNKAKLWKVSGRQLEPLKWTPGGEALDDTVSTIFGSDGKHLIMVTITNTQLWNIASDSIHFSRVLINSAARFGAFSPDGRELAISDLGLNCKDLGISDHEDRVSVLDTATGGCLFTLPGSSAIYDRLGFSPDGAKLATVGSGLMRTWTALPGNEQVSPSGVPTGINRVAFSPNASLIAAAGSDSTVIIWDSRKGTKLKELPTLGGHESVVYDIAFSPDGTRLASSSSDGTVMVWDPDSDERQIPRPIIHAGSVKDVGVRGVAFSSDCKKLATVSGDKTVRLWDAETGDSVSFLSSGRDDNRLLSVAFSPDGKYLASGSLNGMIDLWNARTLQLLKAPRGHHSPVVKVEFTHDSSRLASASTDGTAKLWSLPSGDELGTFQGHKRGVSAVAFSPDGKRLATGSADQTVKIWDVDSHLELFTLLGHAGEVKGVAFSTDGRLATAGADGNVLVYAVDTESLKRLARERVGNNVPLTIAECKKYHVRANRSPGEPEAPQESHCHALDLIQEGEELIEADRDPEAIRNFRTAESLDPTLKFKDTAAQSFLASGKKLLETDQIADAVDDFQKARDYGTSPGNVKDAARQLSGKGETLAKGGNIQGAVEAFRGAQDLDPSLKIDPEARANKARAAALLSEGDNLASAGKIDDAVKKFRNAQELDPSLEIDPQARANKPRAAALLREGDALAGTGKIDDAVKKFRNAQELDPSLKIDPQARANKAAAAVTVRNALDALRKGTVQVKHAVAEFTKAEQLDSQSITAFNWNDLCWFGTLLDGAGDVLSACDRAVQAAPKDWHIIDSRGLARGLASDVPGAIEDFQVVVTNADNTELKRQRQTWVDALKVGQNPFSQSVMDSLRKQSGLVYQTK
jgi:WD40 repeat protein